MEPSKKRIQLNSSNGYFISQGNIDIARDIRKHIEKTEIIVKKESFRQAKKK